MADAASSVEAMAPSCPLPDPTPTTTANINNTASMTPPSSADGDKVGEKTSPGPSIAAFATTASTSPSSSSSTTSDLSDMDLDSNANTTTTAPDSTTAADEIFPDHYYGGGRIPVFKPTMDQFCDFASFVRKVDHYGMKSGVIKVIPPKEWTDALPPLEEAIKTIRVKNPIMQEFHGSHGTFTQANIEKQRSYNLPQWKALCEESSHQPPARRGERRRNQEKVTRGGAHKQQSRSNSQRRKPGPKTKRVEIVDNNNNNAVKLREDSAETHVDKSKPESPPTPVSPESKPMETKTEVLSDREVLPPPKPKGRQPKSVSARRKYNRGDAADYIDEEAFKDFDYRLSGTEEFTSERCEELETAYWKSLMYNNPMYGADMPGSLFDDSVTSWNVAKLPNLLDILGQKVPGVNTAYLYLGMWKATFAWHLEDVDLYSINYIHFGAPKQWYSISQEDLGKFEAAMKSIWPTDAKNCDQFLRHKTYLISPALLKSQFGINVNKLVHFEGEFVITYPYGYHSGFNLGYNCAESVNFATESWLDYARVAKKCNCEADSVWIDISEIERKLRGESTPEYYDEDIEMGSDDEDMTMDGASDLLTPPRSVPEKLGVTRGRKRKCDSHESSSKGKRAKMHGEDGPKKIRCVLCPNSMDYEELLATEDGKSHAHRRCATYIEETTILKDESGTEVVCDIDKVPKARLGLKCLYCREINGACFQCMHGKCTRAYHPTCALLAGVQVEFGSVAVIADDGFEYSVPGVDLKCKYHRPKKYAYMQGETLDLDPKFTAVAKGLREGELVQFQVDREIIGCVVLENRVGERVLLVKVLPRGDVIELPYRFLLIVRKSSFPPLPPGIKPLPSHLARKPDSKKDLASSLPSPGTPFGDARFIYQWGEFVLFNLPFNSSTTHVDLSKPEQMWYYLGKSSTECRAQYTDNPDKPLHNPRSQFLESVKSLNAPVVTAVPQLHGPSYARNHPSRPFSRPFSRHPVAAPPYPIVTSSVSVPITASVSQPAQQQTTAKSQLVKSPTVTSHQPIPPPQNTSHPSPSQLGSPQVLSEKQRPPEPQNNNTNNANNSNHKLPVWASDITLQFAMARRLVASITDHANLRAGYTIVNSDFVVQTLLGQAGSVLPTNGMEKLKTAMAESMVRPKSDNSHSNSSDNHNNNSSSSSPPPPPPLQPLNMKADEVDHLLRMLRFALMNLTTKVTGAAGMVEKKSPKKSTPQAPAKEELSGDDGDVSGLLIRPKLEGKYTYLDVQRRQSASVYQSPYAPGFGFSEYAKKAYRLVGGGDDNDEMAQQQGSQSLSLRYFESLSRTDKDKVIEACGVEVTRPRLRTRNGKPVVDEEETLDNAVLDGDGSHGHGHGHRHSSVSRFGQSASSLNGPASSLDAMALDHHHHHNHHNDHQNHSHHDHDHDHDHDHLSVFDISMAMHTQTQMHFPLHQADSPASSSFGRPQLRYQSPQDFSHIEHESFMLPRHLQLQLHEHDHDLFGDQHANQRFWQRSVMPWVDGQRCDGDGDGDGDSHCGGSRAGSRTGDGDDDPLGINGVGVGVGVGIGVGSGGGGAMGVADGGLQSPDEQPHHRPFFGPFRPSGHDYASSDMDIGLGRGPGSLHSMDMAGFGFDGPEEGEGEGEGEKEGQDVDANEGGHGDEVSKGSSP
ncbi:hypothetical protein GX48_05043 [Paracoccidioides brasiliensis]|nr:hypothetical protein GX48_05043 [Paracoccidioides brasiliensis]